MPCLQTNLSALFALRAATFCALGAPRARDVGGRYYGTVVRAHGRWSPGDLRGKTRPRWKCSLMVVKRAWAILMDRWSTACCFWIHCAHPVSVDADRQADHPLHAADRRAFLDWPQGNFLALSSGIFSLAQTFPMPRCIQGCRRMLIVSSMI